MSTEDPIILVDGSSYLYRAYHALPPLENSKNQPTGAIKGVISMIKKIRIDHPESDLAVVLTLKVRPLGMTCIRNTKPIAPVCQRI